MTKIKENMKAVIIAGLCMAFSATIMVVGIYHGVSNKTVSEAIELKNQEKEIEQVTKEEPVLSSVMVTEVETVASVEQKIYSISESDYDALLKIVEAEAGGEDEIGRILVANVILNRAFGPKFPNTVGEVIFSPGQFTPTQYSDFNSIQVSELTKIAVDKALAGEDYSNGALYFCANYVSGAFSYYTVVLQHGGHTFFI